MLGKLLQPAWCLYDAARVGSCPARTWHCSCCARATKSRRWAASKLQRSIRQPRPAPSALRAAATHCARVPLLPGPAMLSWRSQALPCQVVHNNRWQSTPQYHLGFR